MLPGRRRLLQDVVRAGQREPRGRGRRRRAGGAPASPRSGSPTCRRASRSSRSRRGRSCCGRRSASCSRTRCSCPASTSPGSPPGLRPGRRRPRRGRRRPRLGKNSRLYKRLVYDLQVAQDVAAFQQAAPRSRRPSWSTVTARAGHGLREILRARRRGDRPAAQEPPTERELDALPATRPRRRSTTAWSGWAGSAARPTSSTPTTSRTGNPDFFEEDLARYRALSPERRAGRGIALPRARDGCSSRSCPRGRRTSRCAEVTR